MTEADLKPLVPSEMLSECYLRTADDVEIYSDLIHIMCFMTEDACYTSKDVFNDLISIAKKLQKRISQVNLHNGSKEIVVSSGCVH